MYYTCSLYEGSNSYGKLIFQRKVQLKVGHEGINWHNVYRRFVSKYRTHLRPGYLMMKDDRGWGVGYMHFDDAYWYLKHKNEAIKVACDGSFTTRTGSGWPPGVDVTRFYSKKDAIANLKTLRRHHKDDESSFKLIKVSVK